MILVDIGNTNINFAWGDKAKLRKFKALPTLKAKRSSLKRIIGQYPDSDILVCSVVPGCDYLFGSFKNAFFAGHDLKIPIVCRYRKNQVGIDRLVCAWAAKKLYPCVRIVVDFGTAITVDFLSAGGTYEGGIILPGIGSTLRVLSNCALLPDKVKLRTRRGLIPRNTTDSIAKGLGCGFAAMLNGVIAQYQSQLSMRRDETVVITGGEAGFICKKLDFTYRIDGHLVLKGLNMLSKNFLASDHRFDVKKIQKNLDKA